MRNTLYASMPDHQVDEYVEVFSEPGVLRATLNWHRAMPDRFLAGPSWTRIELSAWLPRLKLGVFSRNCGT